MCLCVAFAFSSFGNAYAGVITGGVVAGKITNLNLTTSSIAEWAVWGEGTSTSLAPTNRSLGSSGISDLTRIDNGSSYLRGMGQFSEPNVTTFQWSNGSPTGSASTVYAGMQNVPLSSGVGEGFSLTTLADTQTRTVNVYAAANRGVMSITATLSDNSAAPLVIFSSPALADNAAHTYSFTYAANSFGQTLNLDLRLITAEGSYSNASIHGVTLSPGTGGSAAVPEPGTSAFAMLLTGGAALRIWRKKRRQNAREFLTA